MKNNVKIKPEYPRPQFVRDAWQNLNGTWNFAFDDEDVGMEQKWFLSKSVFEKEIVVPFVFQSKLSGINNTGEHEVVWYQRTFDLDEHMEGREVLLHFCAVDYEAKVFVNGTFVGSHEGGGTPFVFDITPYLSGTTQTLTVRVWDPCRGETIPRGKQFWKPKPEGIWYTPSTGIWQTVWIEYAPKQRIERLEFTSLFDEGKEEISCMLSDSCGKDLFLTYRIFMEEEEVAGGSVQCLTGTLNWSVDLIQNHIFRTNFHDGGWAWTPENPKLFDVVFRLMDAQGGVLDEVSGYFGFRKVHTENHRIYLNNKPYYQRLVLDQGYWPDGLLTAPTDDALRYDIEAGKKLGFNGCRKHQKTEEERFLYWADKLGYLVWSECASVPTFGKDQVKRTAFEWAEIVRRDYNHPSVVTWVALNESWGVPNIHGDVVQQHYSQMLYHFLHAIDHTRLVISNDGWEMTETDVCAIHNYAHGQCNEIEKTKEFRMGLSTREELLHHSPTEWDVYAKGFEDKGAPIVLSEFGGIGFDCASKKEGAWGYTKVHTKEEFLEEYRRVIDTVLSAKVLAGFCYTQLTDVEQEINGLMTYDRKWKCDNEKIREINLQKKGVCDL